MALASGAHMSAPWKHLLDMLRNQLPLCFQGAREKVKKTREWRNLMLTVSQGCRSGYQTVNKTNTVFHCVLLARLFSKISVWHCCRGVAEEQEEGERGGETWGAQCLFVSAWNASASRRHRRLCWRADKSYAHSEVCRWAGRDLNETPFKTKTCLRFNTVQLRLPWRDMAQQKAPRLPLRWLRQLNLHQHSVQPFRCIFWRPEMQCALGLGFPCQKVDKVKQKQRPDAIAEMAAALST